MTRHGGGLNYRIWISPPVKFSTVSEENSTNVAYPIQEDTQMTILGEYMTKLHLTHDAMIELIANWDEFNKKGMIGDCALRNLAGEYAVEVKMPNHNVVDSMKHIAHWVIRTMLDDALAGGYRYTTVTPDTVSRRGNKQAIWASDYNHIPWEEFRDDYVECQKCGSWGSVYDGPCMCYTR